MGNRATGARESRTRAAAKHSEAPHPRGGNGGATGCYGDDNGKSRSEAKTSVQSPRWQWVEQPEQPEHSHRDADQRDEPARLQRPHGRADGPDPDKHLDADHGEHDDHLLLVVQLRAPPDANCVDALMRESAKDEPEHGAAGAWKSEHRRTFGISVMWSDKLTPGSELEFKWKIMTPSPYVDYYFI